MREGVATGGGGTTDRGKSSSVILQSITDVVETEGSGHLAEDEGDDVTPRGERAGLLFAPMFAGEL